jgi:hypothetical protein
MNFKNVSCSAVVDYLGIFPANIIKCSVKYFADAFHSVICIVFIAFQLLRGNVGLLWNLLTLLNFIEKFGDYTNDMKKTK